MYICMQALQHACACLDYSSCLSQSYQPYFYFFQLWKQKSAFLDQPACICLSLWEGLVDENRNEPTEAYWTAPRRKQSGKQGCVRKVDKVNRQTAPRDMSRNRRRGQGNSGAGSASNPDGLSLACPQQQCTGRACTKSNVKDTKTS